MHLYNLRNYSVVQKKIPSTRKLIGYVRQTTESSPVTCYTGGPKIQLMFEHFYDNTELCWCAERCHSFESCGGYRFNNVCNFNLTLTTNLHTPARTTPHTLTHNSIAYAQRTCMTTHHTVSMTHSSRNYQGRNQ
jgi:hypothetical protein